MHLRPIVAAVVAAFLLMPDATGQELTTPAPWFTDVADDVGLTDVRGKDCIFTDLDGDGYWDLVLARRRFFRSRKGGTKFKELEDTGIPYPEIKFVPLNANGKPDKEKTKKRDLVPQYLYFADVDNDGDQDALYGIKVHWEHFDGSKFVTVPKADHGHRSKVFLNDGRARFTAAPASPFAAPDSAGASMALAIVDVDADGALDLFEGREYRRYGVLYGCGVDRLWKGDGGGGFVDGTEAAGLMTVPEPALDGSSRPSYGVTHADLDNDGDQDLLALSYGRQWNRQWRNDGNGRFTDVGRETMFAGDSIQHGRYPEWVRKRGRKDEAPFRSNGNTFDCAVADYDNDGDLDCFLAEITHGWAGEASDLSALLINERWGFRRATVAEFLPPRPRRDDKNWNNGDLHTGWADLDNDGLQDLLIASGDYPDGQFLRIYRQLPDHTFEDATDAAQLGWEGCGSLSLGDFDRDGDVDILIGRSFMRLSQAHRDEHMGGIKINQVGLLRNDVANRNGNHWLNVRLVGSGAGGANRDGIGARIEMTAGGVTQTREIRCGSGLANHQDPPEACFGLGANESVTRLVVRWPDGKKSVSRFDDLPADRFVTVTQGAEKPRLETAGAR